MRIFKNKVLIVEDSPTTQKLIGLHVNNSPNLRPVFALDYKSARKVLRQMGSDQILCAVLDLNLPDAPNGEVVDLVQEYQIPIIILTGQKSKAIQKTMEAKNIIDYVVKKHYRELEYIKDKVEGLYLNQKATVLVVDDSKGCQNMIKLSLENLCFNVLLCSGADEALEIIEKQEVTLAIIDCHMEGIDGIELTEILRDTYLKEDLAIIGVSGQGADNIAAKFLKIGANDYMYKPLITSEFYCRVQHNIDMLRNIRIIKKAGR